MKKKKQQILLIDDTQTELDIMENMLKKEYDLRLFDRGYDAVEYLLAVENLPNAIVLDVKMPGMDGFQVLEILKNNSRLFNIPVIMITADSSEMRALSAGAADFISKPFSAGILRMRIENQLALRGYTDHLEQKVRQQVEKSLALRDHIMSTMANIIEYRNMESGKHVKRTIELFSILVKTLQKNSEFEEDLQELSQEAIIKSVSLHDVGKIGIPDRILLKPGKLTDDEFEIMKTHTTIGKVIVDSILKDMDEDIYLKHSSDIVYGHHEKYDGTGYPRQLSGEEIPLSARIMAVVDVYDALVNKRVYKEASTHEEAMKIICQEAGTHFDPQIVMAAEQVNDEFQKVQHQYKDTL